MNGSDIVTTSNATIDLAPNGTGTVVVRGNTNSGAIVFNCESNSHGQTVIAQPHSAGVTNTLTLPAGSSSTLVSLVSTDTLTNKTLTTPVIAEIDSGADITLDATNDVNIPANVGLTLGDDGEKIEGDGTDLTIASSGVLNLAAGGSTNQIKVTDGAILPITDDDVDLGSASYQFKNGYFDGTLEADAMTIGGTAITAGGATKGFAIALAVAL